MNVTVKFEIKSVPSEKVAELLAKIEQIESEYSVSSPFIPIRHAGKVWTKRDELGEGVLKGIGKVFSDSLHSED